MELVSVSLHTEDAEDDRSRRAIRIVVPSAPDWPVALLSRERDRYSDPETLLLALRLAGNTDLSTLWKRRNLRHLRINRLARDRSFRELARSLGHSGEPQDLIPRLYGQVSKSIEDGLAEARYAVPLRAVPVDEGSYSEFRSMLLDEIDEAHAVFERKLRERGLPTSLSEDARLDGSSAFVRHVFRRARALEDNQNSKLAQFSDRAESILRRAERRNFDNPRAPLRTRFDWIEVDRLLFDALTALVELRPTNSAADDEGIEGLKAVRNVGTVLDKAEAVRWIWRHLRDRTPLLEHFLMDVDRATPYILGEACRELYRDLRHFLDRSERRLFVLMYLQHVPMFGGPSPSFPLGGITFPFDPVLQGAIGDSRMSTLITSVIGDKHERSAGAGAVQESYPTTTRIWSGSASPR
jgi:hypothetical protein